ncbi:MAG: hypothetical protein H7Y13_09920 [Sphingobacteriaceae bacterium]|nr:hypothetical protein [Sphingobacteriaceae bacterium]
MEKYNLQVMLSDGSFADYEVQTEREAKTFDILKKGEIIASFSATTDGGWLLENNPGKVDDDLQQRITRQLNGYRIS